MLVVEGLVKRFGGFRAVNNVSFKVEKGEILGLIGPNGSGKSTIFNMLSGTFPPTSGSMTFDGHELAGLPPHEHVGCERVDGGGDLKPLAGPDPKPRHSVCAAAAQRAPILAGPGSRPVGARHRGPRRLRCLMRSVRHSGAWHAPGPVER